MNELHLELLRNIVKSWKEAAWKAKVAQSEADAMLKILNDFTRESVERGHLPIVFYRNGIECRTADFPELFCDSMLDERRE